MTEPHYLHLPPLNTLRVFEVAARHESFAIAANELYLTASAVAHQIKKLEASLGIALFVRHSRGVSLSPQGRAYFGHVQQCLDELHRHSEQVKDFTLRPLRISTQHAIAQLWLQPRLGAYQDQYNDRELEITVRSQINDAPTDVDIAISYYTEPPVDNNWQPLWEERLLPVCHPKFVQQDPVLYRDAHWLNDWDCWQQQAMTQISSLSMSEFSRIRSVSLYVLALQSVLDRRGIMVARLTLLQDHLDHGQLVAWPDPETPTVACGAYYLYQSPASLNNPFANDFREWLFQCGGGRTNVTN